MSDEVFNLLGVERSHLGWVPPDSRDLPMEEAHDEAMASMPAFAIFGDSSADIEKAWLFDFAKAANGGAHLMPYYQETGSCFPAGTLVRMADGTEKPIEQIIIGDEVVTHTGAARRVVDTMSRDYSGDMVTLQVMGFPFPLTMTSNHRVAILRGGGGYRWKPCAIEWVASNEVEENDCMLIGWRRDQLQTQTAIDVADVIGERAMVMDEIMEQVNGDDAPISNISAAKWLCRKTGVDWKGKVKLVNGRYNNAVNRSIPLSPSFARLIGLYLAEGGCNAGRVTFTFHAKEEHIAAEVIALVRGMFGVEGEIYKQPNRPTIVKARFNNSTLAAFLSAFVPGNVYAKRVPGAFFNCGEQTRIALLLGWMAGDGHVKGTCGDIPRAKIVGVTVCELLARDMATLAITCGLTASVQARKPIGRSRRAFSVSLAGKKAVSLFPQLAGVATKLERLTDTNIFRTKFGFARKVKRITTHAVTGLRVYDFEVEEDHSFIAGGLTVHNCVGQGAGRAIDILQAVEIIHHGEPEEFSPCFVGYHYGRGRLHSGMRGRGDGSTGSGQAKAVRDDGVVFARADGIPKPFERNAGLTWGAKVETEWSDGARIGNQWLEYGRRHLVKTTAQCRNAADVKAAICNGYPVTIASDWGGMMQPPVKDGVLLNRRADRWMHQMCVLAFWKHETHGDIYWIQNSWGDAHGACPSGAPVGGFWVKAEEINVIAAQGETFAYSQFDGYPAQPDLFMLI